ncbi:MAG: membrane protein insertase YidC [Deltaproteobacteria bacterium]|nr:membrane protein insertase YidC [Deltaproteobacteria bacterium]
MDDSSQNQRLMLAALLCLGVLAGWGVLFPQPKKPPKPAPSVQAPAVAGSTQIAGSTQSATVAFVKTATVAPTAPVEPKKTDFSGQVVAHPEQPAIPFFVSFTNVGGGIASFTIPSYKERDASNRPTSDPIQLAFDDQPQDGRMAGISLLDGSTFTLPPSATFEIVETKADGVVYRYVTHEGVTIEREWRVSKDSFELEHAITIKNTSAAPQKHRLAIQAALERKGATAASGFLFIPPPDNLNASCYADGKVHRNLQTSLVGKIESYSEGVRWAAIERQYFLASLVLRDVADARCELSAKGSIATSKLVLPLVELRPGEERRHKLTAFLGVKKPELLTRANADLESAVDYTILGLDLSLLCQLLLKILGLIHGFTGSWGVAILGLTVLVKLVLFPLNQRAGRNMKAMADIKPELEKAQAKFPNDRQRLAEEQMRLYKEHGVNPASGCVPILLQMPIWFALYRALWVSVDLYQQPFLWIPDLTARDPYWILAVALVVQMFLQQKLTPTTMDPAQQKMMLYLMPALFGGMMAVLPAGLAFYMLVNGLLTILQQQFINKTIRPNPGPTPPSGATA